MVHHDRNERFEKYPVFLHVPWFLVSKSIERKKPKDFGKLILEMTMCAILEYLMNKHRNYKA